MDNPSDVPGARTAIIVGAGVGGVALAARLGKAGYQVTVVEKNDFTGGRCSLLHDHGYRFDQGPSLVLLPELFEEAFADLDTTLEAEDVHLVKCEPNYLVHFDDGQKIVMSSDLSTMKNELERWEGPDGFERFLQFLQEAHRHYEVSLEHVLHRNFTSIFSILRPSFFKHIIDLHPFESIYSRASKYFRTERLRRVFTFSSMYMGMSPFDAPGTYSLLQYAELVRAIWYPIGGFHKVIEGLVGVGKRFGVTYRLSAPVVSVDLSADGKRAVGVTLASGEKLSASLVIVNADLVYAFNNLLPPTAAARRLSARQASCSSISFYWALSSKVPQLSAHNIFLAGEYRASFDAIFKERRLPDEPSFYVNVPSRADPTAAPEGADSVVVLLPVGHLQDEHTGGIKDDIDWDKVISAARETVIKTIEARTGVKDLGSLIIHEQVNNPITWKDKFNLDKGGILGLSHSFFNVLSFRPKTAHPSISDLYFVGASTHPGTGVPICLAGAKLVAEQILSHRNERIPWPKYKADKQQAKVSALDVLHPVSGLTFPQLLFLLALGLVLVIATQLLQ